MRRATFGRALAGLTLSALGAAALAAGESGPGDLRTLRADLYHFGNVLDEVYSLDRLVVEPLPWAGNPDRLVDTSNLGDYLAEIVDPRTNEVLYSRGFSPLFQEWRETSLAQQGWGTFHESVRFPDFGRVVRLRISRRDDANRFAALWSTEIDPEGLHVERRAPPRRGEVLSIRRSGPASHKVDLLFVADGYTAGEREAFEADVRRLSDRLLSISPFSDRADDFNVWAIHVPAEESGTDRPSNGTYRWSPTGTTYDVFGAERYMLALDNQGLRTVAQNAPYDFLIVVANSATYGGGGVFGSHAATAAGSEWGWYLMIHEFGHHFAALADEYYTSYQVYDVESPERPEPWARNVTAEADPARLKWRDLLTPGVPVPTPWPKEALEEFQRGNQKRRLELREQNRPESEMNQLFTDERKFVDELLSSSSYRAAVGLFEGANYEAQGYFRPEIDCMMFSRTEHFCRVCSRTIEEVIDLYTGGTQGGN